MSTTTGTPTVDNGVNVDALLEAREALAETPAGAQFVFRASNRWIRGVHSTTTIENYFGLGEEHSHQQAFTVETDHPEVFAATDNAMTPPEMVLAGLAGCLTAGIASVATNWDVQLDAVTATVEGDMNVLGVLGGDPDVRNGMGEIRVKYQVDADTDRQTIEAIIAQSQKRSAVYDIVTNPTDVVVELV